MLAKNSTDGTHYLLDTYSLLTPHHLALGTISIFFLAGPTQVPHRSHAGPTVRSCLMLNRVGMCYHESVNRSTGLARQSVVPSMPCIFVLVVRHMCSVDSGCMRLKVPYSRPSPCSDWHAGNALVEYSILPVYYSEHRSRIRTGSKCRSL